MEEEWQAAFDALLELLPSQLDTVILRLGLADEFLPGPGTAPATKCASVVKLCRQRREGPGPIQACIRRVASHLLPDPDPVLSAHQTRAADLLRELYPLRSHREGLAGRLDLPAGVARTVDELLAQVPSRRELRNLVAVMLEDLAEQEWTGRPAYAALGEIARALAEQDGDEALLVPWLEWVSQSHERLLACHTWIRSRELKDVFVGVRVAGRAAADPDGLEPFEGLGCKRERRGSVEPRKLQDVIRDSPDRLWTLVGAPGAGKTTLLRRVAIEAADTALKALRRGQPARLPIYVSLVQWDKARKHLLTFVEDEARPHIEGLPDGLAAVLREALGKGQGLVLLDGLDEVEPSRIPEVTAEVDRLSREWGDSVVVVSSRPHGYARPSERFGELELQPLRAEDRLALAGKWLPQDKAEDLCRRVEADPSLRALGELPLLMTMICLVDKASSAKVRGQRAALYDEVVKLLLSGKPVSGGRAREIQARDTCEKLLAHVGLALLQRGGVEWDLGDIEAILLLDEARYSKVRIAFGGVAGFLAEVEDVSGLLFAVDPDRTRFRFLHRSLQELLAARALLALGERAWLDRAKQVQSEEGRWGEVFALLAGLIESEPKARSLLRELSEARPSVGLRALASCDRLPHAAIAEVLRLGRLEPDWTGYPDDAKSKELGERRSYFASLASRLGEDEAAVNLIERLLPGATVLDLAFMHLALQGIDHESARRLLAGRRFFELARRSTPPDDVRWVRVEAGSFLMGSPDEEEGGYDGEHPRHRVELTGPFEMLATPVTRGTYEQFAPEHGPAPRSGPDAERHPVVNVSWYEAMIFAAWLGGTLPTEAQWEYACRAGSAGRWCFGDDEAGLRDHAWFEANSGNQTQPVGALRPNEWGLHDMHGNVWEWCLDDARTYRADPVVDPLGDLDGAGRAVRGGSAWREPRFVRSAFRLRNEVGIRNGFLGFRCVRSPLRQP